jgi:hypothetical protein
MSDDTRDATELRPGRGLDVRARVTRRSRETNREQRYKHCDPVGTAWEPSVRRRLGAIPSGERIKMGCRRHERFPVKYSGVKAVAVRR